MGSKERSPNAESKMFRLKMIAGSCLRRAPEDAAVRVGRRMTISGSV